MAHQRAQLRQLQADFAHAARISTLGGLVASIAHEVKQPLTAIIINGGTGLRWLSRGDAPDKVAARIERIIDSAEQANEIIQRIQQMAVKREPVWADLDLNEVIDEALQFVRYESIEKDVRIVTDLDRATRIDFDKLRERFSKGQKRSQTQKLRTAVERKLEELAAQNPTRSSLVERFQELIAEYNAGSLNVERLFEVLLAFIHDLDEEGIERFAKACPKRNSRSSISSPSPNRS